MLFNELTNMSLFCFRMVSIHKLYARCSYCIFYGSMSEGRLWKEILGRRSLAADHPLFRASIVVNLANKRQWYWEQRMVKLIVNYIKSFRNYQQHCKTWKERPHMWKPLRWHFFAIIKPTLDSIYDSIAKCCCRFPWLCLVITEICTCATITHNL